MNTSILNSLRMVWLQAIFLEGLVEAERHQRLVILMECQTKPELERLTPRLSHEGPIISVPFKSH